MESCGAKRAEISLTEFSGVWAYTPVIDQGEFNVCRFVTTTELLQAAVHYTNPQIKMLSWVALFADTASRSGQHSIKNMVEAARSKGMCTVDAVAAAARETRASCAEVGRAQAALLSELPRSVPSKQCDAPNADEMGSLVLARSSFILAKAIGAESSNYKDISQRVDSVCHTNRVDVSPIGDVEYIFGYKYPLPTRLVALRKHIDRTLELAKPMPIGISYCADVLKNPTSTGLDPTDGKHTSRLCAEYHASSIIGRRIKRRRHETEFYAP